MTNLVIFWISYQIVLEVSDWKDITNFELLLVCKNNACALTIFQDVSSRCIPKCFWVDICSTVELLNRRGGWYTLFIFHEKIASWTCFDRSRLKEIFHLFDRRLILLRSSFIFCKVLIVLLTTENIKVSSAKSFTSESNGPRIKPWCTPALIVSNSNYCPFRRIHCCFSNKEDSIKVRRSPFILYLIKRFKYIWKSTCNL